MDIAAWLRGLGRRPICSTAPIRCGTRGTVDMKMSSPRALLMS